MSEPFRWYVGNRVDTRVRYVTNWPTRTTLYDQVEELVWMPVMISVSIERRGEAYERLRQEMWDR